MGLRIVIKSKNKKNKEIKIDKSKFISILDYVLSIFIPSIATIWSLGIKENGRRYYWKFFVSTLLKYPRSFPLSMSLAVYGFHFRKVVEKYINLSNEDILDISQLNMNGKVVLDV